MKILIINGSHRIGNTDILTSELKRQLLEQKIDASELLLRNIEMKLPDGCDDCANGEICKNVKDQFSQEIEPTIHDYDVYILATPTWDDGVTPLIKIFWDRIVSWCHQDRMLLKGKKLAVVTHGMADEESRNMTIGWVKRVCVWEQSIFGGSLAIKSDASIGSIQIDKEKIKQFVGNLL